VSKHLQVLLQQGFVDQRKQGTTTWYRVTDQQVFKMCELVGSWLEEELAQKRRLLRRRG
jgi:DNA-binding transcriptional ArsR family regulator